MGKETKKNIKKAGQRTGGKREKKPENMDLAGQQNDFEKPDGPKRKAARRHILAVRVKKTAKKTGLAFAEADEIANYLDEAQSQARAEIIAKPDPGIIHEFADKPDKDKKLLMWIGVIGCMLAITVIWIFNIKETFKQTAAQNNDQILAGWDKNADQLAEQMEKIRVELDKIQEFSASSTEILAITSTENNLSATSALQTIGVEELVQLKNKIENIATSTR
jgi:hypothetical protein